MTITCGMVGAILLRGIERREFDIYRTSSAGLKEIYL